MTAAVIDPVMIKLDVDLEQRVQRLVKLRHGTLHTFVREAIAQYVEREEKRELWHQDTLKAWQTYRSTGLHLSADEADAWLAQLEQGIDSEPPECHV